jgi:hypothetical protein
MGDEARMLSGAERTIPVTRLHMPVVMVAGVLISLLGIGGASWRLIAHAEAKHIHLDEAGVIEGGGVAYKNDVRTAEAAFERGLAEQHKKIRKLLRQVELRCKRVQGETVCSIDVPEEE